MPTRWSATENVAWRSALPGPGAASPIVVGDRVFVTCYSQDSGAGVVRHLVCVARGDGKQLWSKPLPVTRPPQAFESVMQKHGYASHSPTSDGRRVFVHFGNSGVYAFDLEGKQLWRVDVGERTSRYGSGASLVVFKGLLLVNASVESHSFLALDPATGREVWRSPLKGSYSTPVVFTDDAGRDVACVTDHDRGVVGFDVKTGKALWRWTGFHEPGYGCSSLVLHDGVMYGTASNEGPIAAFRPSGSGDITRSAVVWRDETRYRPRVTSPIVHDGKLFWIENSVGVVYDLATGKRLAGERLPWKTCYATPLLADGRLYITTGHEGTFVLRADTSFTQVAQNVIEEDGERGVQLNASPVPHRGQLLIRTNAALYCIGATRP